MAECDCAAATEGKWADKHARNCAVFDYDPEAKKRGAQDFRRGVPITANPYMWEQSNRDLAWQRGWWDAEKEALAS